MYNLALFFWVVFSIDGDFIQKDHVNWSQRKTISSPNGRTSLKFDPIFDENSSSIVYLYNTRKPRLPRKIYKMSRDIDVYWSKTGNEFVFVEKPYEGGFTITAFKLSLTNKANHVEEFSYKKIRESVDNKLGYSRLAARYDISLVQEKGLKINVSGFSIPRLSGSGVRFCYSFPFNFRDMKVNYNRVSVC